MEESNSTSENVHEPKNQGVGTNGTNPLQSTTSRIDEEPEDTGLSDEGDEKAGVDDDNGEYPSGQRLALIVVSTMLNMFLISLDQVCPSFPFPLSSRENPPAELEGIIPTNITSTDHPRHRHPQDYR
jgi:hypothetical protein